MPEVDPNSSVNLDGLSDFELRQFETPARSSRHRTEAFVPALPMAVLVAVVEAGSESLAGDFGDPPATQDDAAGMDANQRSGLESCGRSKCKEAGSNHAQAEATARFPTRRAAQDAIVPLSSREGAPVGSHMRGAVPGDFLPGAGP